MKTKNCLALYLSCLVTWSCWNATPISAGEANDGQEVWDVSHPPGDWQTITIDTAETTWSNLDVAPDGKTLVFDMLGDLYTVPISGGEVTPLTQGIEWNIQPRFSPDGQKIAFISDRDGADNLWVMEVDGSKPMQISQESKHIVANPGWSPDGTLLVAKKSFMSTRSIGAGEIWLFHVGGGDGLILTERPHGDRDQKLMAEPAFSTDGRFVYFSQDVTPGRVWQYSKDSTGSIFAIKRLDRETGEIETFVSGPGGAIRPTPSPDGRYLAFIRRLPGLTSAIFLKDLESGNERAVYDRFERDLQESSGTEGNAPSIAWTPDSREIVFWTAGKFHRVDIESRKVAEIPVHVRVQKQIQQAVRFPVEVAPAETPVKMLRWSQLTSDDGTAVFQALGHIYLRSVGGGHPRRLTSQTDHYEFYPVVTPDGSSVVYTTWNDDELGSVRVAPLDDGEGRVLTSQPGHYVEPAVSRDGDLVTYRKINGGGLLAPFWSLDLGIYVVPTAGGDPRRVSPSGRRPHFGADTDRLFFSASGDGTALQLKSVSLSGLDERTHLEGEHITEFRLSPDGRWIAFTERYNAYIAPFALSGRSIDVGQGISSIPVQQVSSRAGEFLNWSTDGTTLRWSMGPVLYQRQLNEAFAFLEGAPTELPEPVDEGLDLSFQVTADQPDGLIALQGGRVVTMQGAREGNREVIENGIVLVEGNRITAVGAAGEVDVPPTAFVLDVSGKTVIPGLIDAHAHGSFGRSEITPQQNWGQFSNLGFGVTTIHDPSNDTTEVFAAAEMQRTGQIISPRIYSTGSILYGAYVPGIHVEIDNLDDARFHIQRLIDAGAISVKSYQLPARSSRQMLLAAARELGIMVVPEGGMKFQHNMNEIIDGHTSIEHSLTVKTAYDDVLQLWSQTEVGYTPTLVVAFGGMEGERYWYQHTDVWKNERLLRYVPRRRVEPRSMRRQKAPEDHYNHIFVARTAKELRDRGVGVHVGAHGQREGLASHWELWMMEQGGFTPWEALRGGTIDAAWHFGMDADIGSIEVGKLADLVVIDGNPLADIRRSEYVDYTMINGRLYDVTTMNQIAPDLVERGPFYFEKEGGDTLLSRGSVEDEENRRHHRCSH